MEWLPLLLVAFVHLSGGLKVPSVWNLTGFEEGKFSACFLAPSGSVGLFPCYEFCKDGNGWWSGEAICRVGVVGGGFQPSSCSFVRPGTHVVRRCLVGARLSFYLRPRALVSRDFLPSLTAVGSVYQS